jgi:hypothetical protein
MEAKMFLSAVTAPIYWRILKTFLIGDVRRTPQESAKSHCLNILSANLVRVAYFRNKLSIRQYIGAGINPVVHAFR